MNEVLIAIAAAALGAIALSAEPGVPSEKAGSRIAQAAPPTDQPPADQKAQPGADDGRDAD
jgi:hypothetical protein